MERKINIFINLLLIYVLILTFAILFVCAIHTFNAFGQSVEGPKPFIHEANDETRKIDKETELDLEFIINEAISRNPEIQAAAQRWEGAKNKIKRVMSLDDPMLRIGVVNSPDHPFNVANKALKSAPIMSPQTISVSQKFPFPGKLRLRGEVATKGAEMQRKQMEAKIQEIIAEVKDAYYSHYLVNKSIEISEENSEEEKGHFPYFFYLPFFRLPTFLRRKGTLPIFLLLTLLSSPYLLW